MSGHQRRHRNNPRDGVPRRPEPPLHSSSPTQTPLHSSSPPPPPFYSSLPTPPLQPPNYYSPPLPPPTYYSPPPPQPYPPNPFHNPNLHQQNPPFFIPPTHLPPLSQQFHNTPQFPPSLQRIDQALQRIDQAVSKAHSDLLHSGESVSACKVSNDALVSLKADDSWTSLESLLCLDSDPWTSLGSHILRAHSLNRIKFVEAKVNAFIHCFVGGHKITSLHDLNVEICRKERVQRFDDLELGPLLQHPLVVHYFSVPPDAKEIVNISGVDIYSYLVQFVDLQTGKPIKTEEFLDFIAVKRSIPVKEKLGIHIRKNKLGYHVNAIIEARRGEDSTLSMYIQSMEKTQIASTEGDEDDDNDAYDEDVQDDSVGSKLCKISSQNNCDQRVSNCPSIATEKKAGLGLEIDMGGQSSLVSDQLRCEKNKRLSVELGAHDLALLHVSDSEKSQHMQRKSLVISDVDKIICFKRIMHFIRTWKEECRLHSAAEVLDKMLRAYNIPDQQREHLIGMFRSFPCVELLHVAVTSIRYGMWDSLYNTFQASVAQDHIHSTSTPSSARDTLPIKNHSSHLDGGISLDDINKKIYAYFDLDHTIEGKTALDKQFVFLRKLHDCEVWLTKQFSAKDFCSLGYGEFNRFLEDHPFLIPDELLKSLHETVSKKSTLEVSMLQRQLVILVSQAASCLWENEAITREHIYKILKMQFPVISFQVSGHGPLEDLSELLKKPENADNYSSVLFSATLLGTDYVKHSLVQDQIHLLGNTGVKQDTALISGALGSVSSKEAIQSLLKAPVLSDLQSWSHWDLIYAPSLGPLIEWLLNEVYTKELLCLVTKDGKIIRIDHSATVDEFLEALLDGSAYKTAVKLLSLFSLYGGERHVPLSLLKCYAQRGIEIILKNSIDSIIVENKSDIYMHDGKTLKEQRARDRESIVQQLPLNLPHKNVEILNLKDRQRVNTEVHVASRFILDCLCYLPSEFRIFAADVLLSGLQPVVKNAASAILRECSQTNQRLMLHGIGLSLNIYEWIEDYRSFSSGTANDVSVSVGASSPLVYCLNSRFKHDMPENLLISDDKMVIDVNDHHEVLGEIHDSKVNKVCTAGCKRNALEFETNHDGAVIVDTIRREEFGLVSGLTEADDIMLKKQHARLGRAIQCLSQELYSQDSHFVLELVQNADDNLYSENVEPTLVFILQSTRIVVLNNETGFTAQNIRALCDVGSSTKKGSNAGYIGKKGIGFKSVFRVTDSPEIHSSGFHVKFDISDGQIGFVLPTVISPCDLVSLSRLLPSEANQTDNCWNTCIVLPFKSKLRDEMGLSTTISLFSDLHPSLLLFLHRLQCIKFKNMLSDTFTVMRREILEDGIVKVSHGKEIMRWFVATQNLQASVIRPDVQTTKIAIAFTLEESSDGEYIPHLEQQPVFSFLPLRTYGLKFILQADFVLPSSREEVDADSAWNQWLLSEFPGLFVSAQRSFCDLRCFQNRQGRAVAAYMSFVPVVGEVHGFFSQLPRMIISKLRVSNCLAVEGKEEWVPPCRVLRGWNEQAHILIPDNILHRHLGLSYLDKDIYLCDSLAKALGVKDYGPSILVEIISSICRTDDGFKSLGLNWLSSWLSALYIMVVHSTGQASVNAFTETDLSGMLRKVPFIPLSDGSFGSIAEGTIWLICDVVDYGFEGEHGSEAFPSLFGNLRIVSPAFLSTDVVNTSHLEELSAENVIKVLLKIGVQRLAAHELIIDHILPALCDDRIAERDMNLMTEYLSFVFLHLQSTCPSCHTERDMIISELQTKGFILTNHGYQRPAEVPIHFSREFGNFVDMTKLIDVMDFDWHEVDSVYINHSSKKSLSFGLTKWRDFFQKLGITDFVQTVEVEKDIADMSHTLLNDLKCNGDLIDSGLCAKDCESPELVHLLSTLSSQNNREKSKYLLGVLDKMWDDWFCNKVRGSFYRSNEEGKQFKSSFIKSFNDFQWMASSTDEKLNYPKDLFNDCEEVRSILGDFAPYAVPQVISRKLLSDIGLKTRVTIDDALGILEVLRSAGSPVTVSIDQISKIYAFIWGEMDTAKIEIERGFSSGPYIFVPFANEPRNVDVVSGKLFSSDEVFWHDSTGSVDLIKEMLLQCGSLNEANHLIDKTLAHVYPGFHDFFVNECKVCEIPPPLSYIQILVQLSQVSSPSQAANSVFKVLLMWVDDLKSGLLETEDIVYLKDCLLRLETTVLPTLRDKWVSLHPKFGLVCWCDNKELQKIFKHSDNIHFLNFGALHEKKVLPAKISGLMQALGVPPLSEVITREAIFDGLDECTEKALLVNRVLPYAQRYVYKLHSDAYIQLKQSGFENICNLQVVVIKNLYFRYTIKGCENASSMQTECSCLLQENNLYVDRASSAHPIFMELSRVFFNGTPELHLANFLHMITIMAESGSTEEQIELFVLNTQNIPRLPHGESVWFLSSSPTLEPSVSAKIDDWTVKADSAMVTDVLLPDTEDKRPLESLVTPSSENVVFKERDQLCYGTPDAIQAAVTGRTGEVVAFKYLSEKVGGAGVKWVNEKKETGLPYDITIEGEREESKEYIEVKTTRSGKKDWFTISTREWQFAVERGECFSIIHVVLKGGGNKAEMKVFKNPPKLCQQGKLQLTLLMPKSEKEMFLVT